MNRTYENFCNNYSNKRTFEASFEDVTKPISGFEKIKNQWKEKCLRLSDMINSVSLCRIGKIGQLVGTFLGICGIGAAVRAENLSVVTGMVLAGALLLLNVPFRKITRS